MRGELSNADSRSNFPANHCAYPSHRSVEHGAPLWRDFGGLKIAEIVCDDTISDCSLDMQPATGDGSGVLILNLEGSATLTHEASELRLQPGDLLFVDGGMSLRRVNHAPSRRILVGLPRTPFPLPAAPCLIDRKDAIAVVLRGLICTLLNGASMFYGREQAVVCDVLMQLVAVACSARDSRPSPRTRMRDTSIRQWRVLRQSIEALLSDPALSPAMVAASQGISTRHLHRLFRQNGVSFGTYVKNRRLQHCRHDLADPKLGALPLTEIAYRWGFSDSSHFSRCFKAAFGCTAREFRIRGSLPSDARSHSISSPP